MSTHVGRVFLPKSIHKQRQNSHKEHKKSQKDDERKALVLAFNYFKSSRIQAVNRRPFPSISFGQTLILSFARWFTIRC